LLRTGRAEEHFREQAKPVDAVPTPLASWNKHCRDDGGGVGLARGWHVTIGANTGYGKSIFSLNCAATAIEHGEHVGFVSLEMSRAQVATRLYAILTKTPVRSLERGETFSPDEAKRVARTVAEIQERTGGAFLVNDRPMYEIDAMLSLMRLFHEEHGCRFFVVDYIQLAGARDFKTLLEQVTNVSSHVREFAKAHNVVTMGLSQFNRETSKDFEHPPTPQGLMGGSPIENDSDQVLLLDHSRYQRNGDRADTCVILGKNRHGSQGEIPVEWDYLTLRVRERTVENGREARND
jgi:replicative DNA helicase